MGGTTPLQEPCRIVGATNRNLTSWQNTAPRTLRDRWKHQPDPRHGRISATTTKYGARSSCQPSPGPYEHRLLGTLWHPTIFARTSWPNTAPGALQDRWKYQLESGHSRISATTTKYGARPSCQCSPGPNEHCLLGALWHPMIFALTSGQNTAPGARQDRWNHRPDPRHGRISAIMTKYGARPSCQCSPGPYEHCLLGALWHPMTFALTSWRKTRDRWNYSSSIFCLWNCDYSRTEWR